jgi:co-chaperonin GroES (HSP10)
MKQNYEDKLNQYNVNLTQVSNLMSESENQSIESELLTILKTGYKLKSDTLDDALVAIDLVIDQKEFDKSFIREVANYVSLYDVANELTGSSKITIDELLFKESLTSTEKKIVGAMIIDNYAQKTGNGKVYFVGEKESLKDSQCLFVAYELDNKVYVLSDDYIGDPCLKTEKDTYKIAIGGIPELGTDLLD